MAIFSGTSFTAGDEGGPQYEAEVNKGAINMGGFTNSLNARYENGYRPLHVVEKDGNTMVVWERFR
jgi:hypothetical protein